MNTIFDMTPWGLLHDLLNIDTDQFNHVWKNLECRAAGRFPPVNVFTDDDAIRLEVLLPGRTAKDVDLTIEDDAIVLADHPAEPEAKDGKPAEKRAPAWVRKIQLPFRADEAKAAASFKDGILRIDLAKMVETPAHRIKIEC
jgi:HSP20 family protein